MTVNKQPQRAMGSLSGKVHPVGAEVEFPHYDLLQQEDILARQEQQVVASLEMSLRNWQSRLKAMLYRTELSLSCELALPNIIPEGSLCFVMEGDDLVPNQPLAWLFVEQACLYQLAEMSFGGEPNPLHTSGPRTLSETERRLGTNLLSLLANELLAQLLLSTGQSCRRRVTLAPVQPDLMTVTCLSSMAPAVL